MRPDRETALRNEGAPYMPNLPLAPCHDDRGQDIAEYALLVAVIVILTIGAIHYFWSAINKMGQ
jgi:hypothetical protein